ncbi:MAG: hypothetical protein KJ042_02695 [Deltaproteobacteria bacterium]|nr:hypothetical protein [Deltaproteobacteria bacterium]
MNLTDRERRRGERRIFFRNSLLVAAIFAWTALVYKDIYALRFFLDDYLHLHLISRIASPITPYTTDLMFGAFYRPGVFWFWKLNWLAGGLNPAVYYAFNMGLLAVTALLLMQYLQHLTGYKGYSAWVTLLYAISPITAQGVLWLSNRFDLLGAVFFLASCVLFLRYLRFHRPWDFTGSLVAGVFSYFCKEMYITLPMVLIASGAFMFHYRGTLTSTIVRRTVILSSPYFVAAAAFMIVRYAILGTMGGYVGEPRVDLTFGYLMGLLSAFGGYVWYFEWPLVTLGLVAVMALLLQKRHFWRANPLLWFGLAFAIITAAPLAMVIRIENVMTYHTPRFFFLPGIGLAMMAAAVYNPRTGPVRRGFARAFVVLMALVGSANTFLVAHHTMETTRRAEKNLTRIDDFLKKEWTADEPAVIYACQRGLDVALDSSLKVWHPEYLDKAFLVNCSGQTQVFSGDALYRSRGGDLTFPATFTKNPSRFGDLWYGVVDVKPRDILAGLASNNHVYAIYKNAQGELTFVTPDRLREQMETLGATFE